MAKYNRMEIECMLIKCNRVCCIYLWVIYVSIASSIIIMLSSYQRSFLPLLLYHEIDYQLMTITIICMCSILGTYDSSKIDNYDNKSNIIYTLIIIFFSYSLTIYIHMYLLWFNIIIVCDDDFHNPHLKWSGDCNYYQ